MDLNQRPMQRQADMLTTRPQNKVDIVSEIGRTAFPALMLKILFIMSS